MTNHFADELREIDRDLDRDPCGYVEITARGRLRALIAYVERLHAEPEPAELEVAGLDPEQEIRGWAVWLAHDGLARVDPELLQAANARRPYVLDVAATYADWIRDGARP
jgi:hypothetical protein